MGFFSNIKKTIVDSFDIEKQEQKKRELIIREKEKQKRLQTEYELLSEKKKTQQLQDKIRKQKPKDDNPFFMQQNKQNKGLL